MEPALNIKYDRTITNLYQAYYTGCHNINRLTRSRDKVDDVELFLEKGGELLIVGMGFFLS